MMTLRGVPLRWISFGKDLWWESPHHGHNILRRKRHINTLNSVCKDTGKINDFLQVRKEDLIRDSI